MNHAKAYTPEQAEQILDKIDLTDKQREVVDLVWIKGMPINKVARELLVDRTTLKERLRHVIMKSSRQGFSPMHDQVNPAPPGQIIKGESILYDADNKPIMTWVKTQQDAQAQLEIMREIVKGMSEEITPVQPVEAPQIDAEKLCNCFVITDYHMGMLADNDEVNASGQTQNDNWDLKIAEDTLVKWFAEAIRISPDADTAVYAQLGDFQHFDLEPLTPASKHLLDADSRAFKIVRATIRVTRQVIRMLLEKHKHVHVKWCDANHDPYSAIWMRELLMALYENEPRVFIDNSADTYYCYEFGKTALFFHHGHKRKVANVDTVFAAKYREVFGRTEHAYAHMGHYHSIDKKETNLMVVEQHRTLASADAYSSRGGWLSGREANVITYHKDYGQVAYNTISYKMIAE
jgi:hypothetical protein